MAHNIDHLHRRSVRLVGYDYSQAGAYFVTICAHNRALLFGDVVNGQVVLNESGMTVCDEWLYTQILRPYIQTDAFVVMPNHFHGIVTIMRDMDTNRRGMACRAPDDGMYDDSLLAGGTARHAPTIDKLFGHSVPGALPTVIGAFKSAATKRINEFRNAPGEPVWQRNYYEHIIRSEKSLNQIRQYIAENPGRWAVDRDNPNAVTPEMKNVWRI